MAVVPVAVEQISIAGINLADTGSLSTSDTYTFPNTGREFVHMKKSGAADCVVTITSVATVGGLAVADPTVTVPASTGDMMIGPFPPAIYGDTVTLAFSNIAGLTIGIARL